MVVVALSLALRSSAVTLGTTFTRIFKFWYPHMALFRLCRSISTGTRRTLEISHKLSGVSKYRTIIRGYDITLYLPPI